LGGLVGMGVGAVVGTIAGLIFTKASVGETLEEGNRLIQQVGPFAILPQLLAALGALFNAAGVGEVIANGISNIIPTGNIVFGVIAYCVGMALFTMIMGNAFAAFAVITAGIGLPFVFSQGANPAIAGALALTAGYCGTLLTPMAANFNIVPAAVLEMKDKYKVIKHKRQWQSHC
jgi:Predicted membrane protein